MPDLIFVISGIIILFVLFIYWVAWRIWLALEGNVLGKFELWNKIPGGVRRPKFWQFAILAYWWTTRKGTR
jgi:hypothetical protein